MEVKYIHTASGKLPLHFKNTKIIYEGKVISLEDFKKVQSGELKIENILDLSGIKEKQTNKLEEEEDEYAVDVGDKAGMDQVNHVNVKRIIREHSRRSEFYKKQGYHMKNVEAKVKRFCYKLKTIKENEPKWNEIKEKVFRVVEKFIKDRSLKRTWLHFDMDMFYAAIEIRDVPSLANKPVAIGNNQMITTTNYIARKYGVKSGVPGYIGRKLCPHLVFVNTNLPKYKKESDKFKDILKRYDPQVEYIGLDEASIDITEYLQQHGLETFEGPIQVAQ